MKIIDLLNKIANGEEVPKKIAIQNEVLIYNEDEILNLQDCYYIADEEDATWKIWAYELNDEVEILEEEKKFTKEDFIKEVMDLEDITREEFNKRYEVKECNCGREYCKGFIRVEKVQEEKKIPEKLKLDLFTKNDVSYYVCKKINEIIDYLKSKGE